MPSDAARASYAYTFYRRQFLGSVLRSGLLESGKVYLARFSSGDDFENVGGPGAASLSSFCSSCSPARRYLVFKATGTTPTTWTHESALQLVDLDGLRAKANEVAASAMDQVVITTGTFEGGTGSGQVMFPKIIVGQVLERLLSELDPDHMPAPSRASGSVLMLP